MNTNQTCSIIPIFPCKSIDEQLDFYQALGFELTYRQAKPNLYACVRHPIIELHFFVLKALEPANSYSMCYVHVPDVDAVYREFCNQLKKTYGKIPSKGFPKITRVNDLAEDRRFNLVDPAGNRLLIGQKHDRPKLISIDLHETVTRFRHAYDIAYKLAYAKDEPAEAARVLDLGFAKAGEESSALCFQACVLRADIAVSMNDWELAVTFVQKAESLPQNDPGQEDVSEAAYRLLELKMILERGYLAD